MGRLIRIVLIAVVAIPGIIGFVLGIIIGYVSGGPMRGATIGCLPLLVGVPIVVILAGGFLGLVPAILVTIWLAFNALAVFVGSTVGGGARAVANRDGR